MEAISRSGRTTTELHHMSKKWKDPRSAQRSPEHTKVWTEPPPNNNRPRRVPVVYYLSRNGNLEHPHFTEVPLSSSDGLYLRDVIDRLDSLRGKGMAALYSWSSKRSYKNGFVWHDLAENDFIYPAQGQEYVLKGSELVVAERASLNSKSEAHLVSSSMSKTSLSPDSEKFGDDDFPVVRRRRNQSWSAIDLHEYKVYTGDSSSGKVASDASTQTDDKRRRWRPIIREEEQEEVKEEEPKSSFHENESSELSREDISPPPSDSSPETLESLMKADGKLLILRPETEDQNQKSNPTASNNKVKASSVLMQLISCGSISFRDCGPGAYGKDNPGFSLVSHYKSRMLPRGMGVRNTGSEEATVEDAVVLRKNRRIKKPNVTEDKEYFSGSLIETKRVAVPALKRSNSYTGDG